MRRKVNTPKPRMYKAVRDVYQDKYKNTSPERRAQIARENGAKTRKRDRAYPKAKTIKKDTNLADLLPDVYHPNASYTAEEKLAAVSAYVTTGTTHGVERATGINQQIVSEWKNKSEWWPEVYAKVKKDKQEELDAKLTEVIHKSVDFLGDKILKGDEIITSQGERMRREISGRDLATIMAILYDKRSMLRGDPTSITVRANQADTLATLRDEFAKMAKEALDNTVVKTI